MSSSDDSSGHSSPPTKRVIRLENPDLIRSQNHTAGRAKFSTTNPDFSTSKAVSAVKTGQANQRRFSKSPSMAVSFQKQIDSARHEVDTALGNKGTELDRQQQRRDHKGSSNNSPYVSTTPHWTMGPESQDDYGGRRLDNPDGFGALVTIADVDSRRVKSNEFNTAEHEELVSLSIKKKEVSHSFWAYPDAAREDGNPYTAVLYDHKNDKMTFGKEAVQGFKDLSNPTEL